MRDGFIAKSGRALGWVAVTIAGIALGSGVAFLPLSYLPGPLHTDYVNGRWVESVAMVYLVAVLTWRLSPMARTARFSPAAAGRFLWLVVTAFALAFWPIGLAAWFNGWKPSAATFHDLVVVGFDSTRFRPAVTPLEHYVAKDPRTGWTADLLGNEERKRSFRIGACVRVAVRSGRLGLDWIDDAKVHPCP